MESKLRKINPTLHIHINNMEESWMNDEDINDYMHLLNATFRTPRSYCSHSFVVDQFFNKFQKSQLNSCQRILSKLPNPEECTRWIIPMNVPKFHWFLVVVLPKLTTVCVYDSFYRSIDSKINLTEGVMDEIDKLLVLLSQYHPRIKHWVMKPCYFVNPQKDAHRCGIYTRLAAEINMIFSATHDTSPSEPYTVLDGLDFHSGEADTDAVLQSRILKYNTARFYNPMKYTAFDFSPTNTEVLAPTLTIHPASVTLPVPVPTRNTRQHELLRLDIRHILSRCQKTRFRMGVIVSERPSFLAATIEELASRMPLQLVSEDLENVCRSEYAWSGGDCRLIPLPLHEVMNNSIYRTLRTSMAKYAHMNDGRNPILLCRDIEEQVLVDSTVLIVVDQQNHEGTRKLRKQMISLASRYCLIATTNELFVGCASELGISQEATFGETAHICCYPSDYWDLGDIHKSPNPRDAYAFEKSAQSKAPSTIWSIDNIFYPLNENEMVTNIHH
jgi:hypothetical protein